MDIAISFPSLGHIRLESRDLFAEPGNETCRQFLERVFQAPEITDVTINSHQKVGELPHADLRFSHTSFALPDVVARVSTCLDPGREKARDALQLEALAGRDPALDDDAAVESPGRASDAPAAASGPHGVTITRVTPIRNEKGQIRFFRYGSVVTNWEVKHEIPGRMRIMNPVIHRKSDLCQAIERELMSVLGVDSLQDQSPDQHDPGAVRPQGTDPRPDHRDH